ncbi:DUF6541 family protein [Amycolatopsis cihanbeyliensis]|uniref:4-amino-4-deoxy-L-arabinose transferase-like glycosyltransferase n=1 Tax=Amycolatopsis cihanbeyliensis TaxID=1128664 RepID=A0A542DMF6_AMYCI|nr:DUF6541 family protein [Amycolatopsis cihanbeyliensis]TQJ04165.1 hypothetical protein FB471_3947 [Amycolatopsis cihanbeyliensis]
MWSQVLSLLAGLLVLTLPGLVLQLLAGVRDLLWLAALTVPVSIGLFTVSGVLSGIPGLALSPLLTVGCLVLLAVPLALLARKLPGARTRARRRGGDFPPAVSPRLVTLARLGGAVLCLGAALLALRPWWSGLGDWSTYPQEHDTITHTWLTAYIARTGTGAPWELLPLDLLTGGPVSFYPSGLPLTAALTGELTAGPIVGFNLVTALAVGPAFVLGCAALAAAILRGLGSGPAWTSLAGGIAALVAAGLYRPGVQLLHDGGIAPNAVAMSLAPGIIAAALTLGGRQWSRAVLLGLGVAGAFAVHPSVAATVGLSLLVCWAVAALTRPGRRELRDRWPVLLTAGTVAGVAALGSLLGALGEATRTGGWPPDTRPAPLGEAVGTNLMFSYGGYLDPDQTYAQLSAALLVLAGVAAVLLTRRGWTALALWGFWLLAGIEFRTSPADGIAATIVGSFFYKSYVRIQSHIALFAPALAAFGLLVTALALARLVVRARRSLPLVPVTAVVLVPLLAGYVFLASIPYAQRNAEAIASRYADPEFVRVDADDRAAVDWLGTRSRPGERMMNSANDGSTYAYVDEGLPVVNVVTLGDAQLPYTYHLLADFREYPDDPAIRAEILRLNIGYVYVDSEAPLIGAGPGAPENWVGEPTFRLAPGLRNLDGLPGLRVAFRSGSVTVYRLDRKVLAGM